MCIIIIVRITLLTTLDNLTFHGEISRNYYHCALQRASIRKKSIKHHVNTNRM